MNESDVESLIERGLSAARPRPAFRDRLLDDSTAVVVRVARGRARWRKAGLALAAVLVGAVSFLGGRLSAPRSLTPSADPAPRVAAERDEVRVPDELVAWLDAANLFRQLGMEDRMARAVERAGRLRPHGRAIVDTTRGRVYATDDRPTVENQRKPSGLAVLPRLYGSSENMNGIMAHSVGGYNHASERD